MADLIQKSVRLPEDLIAYVEQQQGRDFSKKLVTLLTDIKDGDAQRKARIETYDRDIRYRQDKLHELGQNMNSVQRALFDLESIVRQITYITSYMPEPKPPGPTPAEP